MKKHINNIINKYKNIKALIVAHGPSANSVISNLQKYKDRGFIIFDCNEFPYFHKVVPNFWCLANPEITMFNWKEKINSYANKGLTVCYADSVDLTDRKWIEKNIITDYIAYDQRHINSKRHDQGGRCDGMTFVGDRSCCDQIIQGRLTIQEELVKYTGLQKLYSVGNTIVIHMLSFAIIMGCNPIYVTGFDLDYKLGYARHPYGEIPPNRWYEFDNSRDKLISDLSIINEHAIKTNRQIINLNANPEYWLKVFPVQENLS